MKWFKNCKDLKEVKATYRDLAMEHHPDRGGSTELMQEINKEYAYAIAYYAKHGTAFDKETQRQRAYTEEEINDEILSAEEYRKALEKVIGLVGIKIELVGYWLWLSGETKKHAATLKKEPQKFVWAKKKDDMSLWFFRTKQFASRNKTRMQMDDIREKYGSKEIKNVSHFKLQ